MCALSWNGREDICDDRFCGDEYKGLGELKGDNHACVHRLSIHEILMKTYHASKTFSHFKVCIIWVLHLLVSGLRMSSLLRLLLLFCPSREYIVYAFVTFYITHSSGLCLKSGKLWYSTCWNSIISTKLWVGSTR